MGSRIITINNVLPEARLEGMPTLDQIAQGHTINRVSHPDMHIGINDNPKMFSYNLIKYTSRLMQAAKYFEGNILVDLGAGRQLDSYIIAGIVGAKAYVAVEAAHSKELYEKLNDIDALKGDAGLREIIENTSKFIAKNGNASRPIARILKEKMQRYLDFGAIDIPVVLIAEDMLAALERIPPHSVSVLASGIDRCIHPQDEYVLEVEKEIARVLHPEGAFIGNFSIFQPKDLRKEIGESDWTFEVYCKEPIQHKD